MADRDELIRVLGEAIEDASMSLIGTDLGTAFRDDIAAAGLDAVLPLIEADLRERLARWVLDCLGYEIPRPTLSPTCSQAAAVSRPPSLKGSCCE